MAEITPCITSGNFLVSRQCQDWRTNRRLKEHDQMKNVYNKLNKAVTAPSNMILGVHSKKSFLWMVLLFVSFITSNPAVADPLTERGIDPAILDLMVSDLRADLSYTRFAEIEAETDQGKTSDRAIIQFDPETDYGIDLYMKFETDRPETGSARQMRHSLENNMRLQHRIRNMEFNYDPSSLVVESQEGGKAVILFRYSMFTLPQEIAWMRHLQGRIWVDGNRPERIRLALDEGRSFFQDGGRVTEFETNATFVRLSNGLDVVLDSESRVVSSSLLGAGTERIVTVRTKAVSFTDMEGRDVAPESVTVPAGIDLADFDKIVRVHLDRMWPIWGKGARKAGFEIPKAFGVSLMYTNLETNYDFTNFEINGESDLIEAIFDPNGSGLDMNAKAPQLRVDWFPFPFINLMAMYGKADAKGDLLVRTTPLGQLLGLPEVVEGVVDTETDLFTVGITLAAGYKNFFGNITAQATNATNSDAGVDTDLASVTAMVGYFFPNYRMRVMAGMEYFDEDSSMVGSIPLPGGEALDFNVGMDQEAWAGRVGIYKEFGNNWEGNLTYTYGDDRKGLTAFFGYRF